MLRYRRLDLVLELSLLALIALGLLGVLVVLVLDPLAVVIVLSAAAITGFALARLLGEGKPGGLILGGVMSLLCLGLYALYLLLDLSFEWAAGLAGAVLLLFATVLVRAVIASADEPPR
jgi:hypothetical protein